MLQQHDEIAFSYLYDNYSGALHGVVNSIITNKEISNDVLQNVFVNIWKKIASYDASKGRLFTWMLNIARNAAIDEVRSKSYRDGQKNQSFPENVDIHVPGAVTGPAIVDVGLRKVLTQLKEEMRVLIDLSYFQGFTHEEIGTILGISEGTSKSNLMKARENLKKMLEKIHKGDLYSRYV